MVQYASKTYPLEESSLMFPVFVSRISHPEDFGFIAWHSSYFFQFRDGSLFSFIKDYLVKQYERCFIIQCLDSYIQTFIHTSQNVLDNRLTWCGYRGRGP